MTLYIRSGGTWVPAKTAYVKRNGIWVLASDAYVRSSGTWKNAYHYDKLPPNPPELTLDIQEDWRNGDLKTRYIRVGARLPGAGNDDDARLTRVLSTYAGKPPTTALGGTYTELPDATYPGEPWSEWRYNKYGPHKDTSVYIYKQWPRNAASGYIIPGDKTYYFGGWSLDNDGNWSIATQAQIHVPKPTVHAANLIYKDARFQPNSSGSWVKADGYAPGDLVQSSNPQSQGLWFYGNQFTDSIGAQTQTGEKITITSAQLRVTRRNDSGTANANIYLFWNGYVSAGDLPPAGGNISRVEVTKLGTLAKGQTKWFNLPESFYNNLNMGLKCIGLDYKDYYKATAFVDDYSEVVSTASDLRCGEVYVQWREEL